MRKLILYCFLIVITDPYRGIKYDEINAYYFETTYNELTITEIEETEPPASVFRKSYEPSDYDFTDKALEDIDSYLNNELE